jgi:UDP-arabinose 4-epimerase
VTGGAGYIGSQTCLALRDAGYEPVVLDDLSTGYADNVKWGVMYEGDVGDAELVSSICDTHSPLGVIHFAGSAYVGESVQKPFKYFVNNTGKTSALMHTLSAKGVNKFVFSSTCATYGEPASELIDENTIQKPINPYGVSKFLVEQMLKSAGEVSPLKFVSLRYFNAAGGNPTAGLVERHFPETHLLPILISAATEGSTFTVNGIDFPTLDGSAVRDFIHIKDLADAHVRSLDYLLDGGQSEFMNLGTGYGTSILELVDVVTSFGYEVDVRFGPRRIGDPAKLVANPAKAKSLLSWEPRFSQIANILQSAGLSAKT